MKNVTVLTFHSVMNHSVNRDWSFLSTPIEVFENTLKFLKKNEYKTISLKELYDLKKGSIQDESKLVVLHFDDGFLDNYTIVYPLLRKYGFKATVFVSPEFVDPRSIKRKQIIYNLERNQEPDLESNWGYMSWEELKELDSSGVIDVQCHAMTHTWYPVGPELVDLHHKGDSFYWMWWNKYPNQKPFWLNTYKSEDVEYGTPVFKFGKSLANRRFLINQEVIEYIKTYYKNLDDINVELNRKKYVKDLNIKIKEVFSDRIGRYESNQELENRFEKELIDSKKIIENKLNKNVNFLAWPGGGKNPLALEVAERAGYHSVTAKGKPYNEKTDNPFLIYRVGGWSGLKLKNKPLYNFEKYFLWMQLHRSKGRDSILNSFFSIIGNVYKQKALNKNIKKGESK